MSFSVPILPFGGYVGLRLFFALSAFPWFFNFFKNDTLDVWGMIVFIFGSAAATFIGTRWAVDRLLPKERTRSL